MKSFLLAVYLLVFGGSVVGQSQQSRRVPKPNYPTLPSPSIPAPAGKPSDSPIPVSVLSLGLPFGQVATPSPEAAKINQFKDAAVNLHTGTASVPLPLYTLQEGSLSLPIGLTYTAVGMKAGEVAPWTGLGWQLQAGGMITRVVRGLPDEGKLELNSFTSDNYTPHAGYYTQYYNAYGNGSNENDKEPDLYYLNIGGQSYKMTYHPFRELGKQFVFFPEADIKVQPIFQSIPSNFGVGNFESWRITLPDGTVYFFGQNNATERSVEIEATFAKDNDIDPSNVRFSRYWKAEAVPSAWYLTKIQSPYGQSIDLEYNTAQYSFFKLADTESSGPCPTSAPDKLINKVYVRGQVPRRISSQNVVVEFNKSCTACYYPVDPETGQEGSEQVCYLLDDCTAPRIDIDQWTKFPQNSSTAKKLNEMRVFDKTGGNTDTLKYSFNYDHFSSDPSAVHNLLPTGYSMGGGGTQVGRTHLFRLRLRSVTLPQAVKYQFNYHFEDAPTTFYSRLSYGVDHWGSLNGSTGVPTYGLLGKEDASSCASLPNRSSNAAYARYGLLKELEMQTDKIPRSRTEFDYESHQADNYQTSPFNYLDIGGARIKAIATTDILTGISTTKRYTYHLPESDNWSSGQLVMRPLYGFHRLNLEYNLNSGLYERVLSETNRPLVGYRFVQERLFSGGLNAANPTSLGHTRYHFEQPSSELTIKATFTVCDLAGNCGAVLLSRPQDFHPAHDYRTGNLLETQTYNAAGQLLEKQQMRYSAFKTDSLLAKKLFRINGQNLGSENNQKYYLVLSQFRLDSTRSYTYDQTGQNPVLQTTTYQYKEDLPDVKYLGQHQFGVQTTTDNADGQTNTVTTRYVADFEFGSDSTFVEATCSDDNGNIVDCSYWNVSDYAPAAPEARAIFYLKQAHVLGAVLESTQTRNGLVVGGSYQSYGEFSAANVSTGVPYFPHYTFALRHLPLISFESVYFDAVLGIMRADTSYYAVGEALAYNGLGLPTEARSVYGPAQRVVYDASGVSMSSTTSNVGVADAQTTAYTYQSKVFGLSKTTAPNGLELRYAYYPDGRLQATKDHNGHLLSYQQYLYPGQTDPSGTVSEDFIFFFRNLSRQPRVATTNPFQNPDQVTTGISYQTALGSLQHQRLYRQSPAANTDIVTNWTRFDAFQRPVAVDLPFPNDDPAVGADEYALYGDAAPAQTVEYEASPLSRPKRGFGAGFAWRQANKAQSMDYLTNSQPVRKYSVSYQGSSVVGNGEHAVGTLFEEQTQDERGLRGRVFADIEGRTVAKWVQDTTDANGQPHYLKTAYVYDEASRLRYVVPPAVHEATANFTEADAIFANGVYGFRYDPRGRLVEKHTPNAGWTYVVYNYLGQAVLTQDARQRQQNLWQWTKYDGHGRTAQTGTWTSTQSRQTLQYFFDIYSEDRQFHQVAPPSGAGGAFPTEITVTGDDLKAEYFYDDYEWVNDANYDFQLYQTPRYANARGLATGSRVRRLDTGEWLQSVAYYDDKNRVIQAISQNRFGRLNQTDVVYNFVGEVLEERSIYRKPNQANLEVKNAYTRDHAGRVTRLTHTLNGKSNVLADYNFDDIGRLKQKKILPLGFAFPAYITRQAATPNSTTDIAAKAVTLLPGFTTTPTQTYAACISNGLIIGPIQTVDYAYHIRGGIRAINSPQTPEGGLNVAENDLFAMNLVREEDGRYYNGLISKQNWLTPSQQGQGAGGGVRSFTYTYDQADRFKAANYTGQSSENYNTAIGSYDLNGNIQTLRRYGQTGAETWGQIDNLSYDYSNKINQLVGITDVSDITKGFKTIGGILGPFTYYPEGSLKSDANRGIDNIVYNYLGLVEKLELTNGRSIEYVFTADGQKLRKTIKETGKADFVVDYVGGLIYHDG
ncbi:MAG: hypothetical protein EAZ32_17140, partial [Cytophagia bacterium]